MTSWVSGRRLMGGIFSLVLICLSSGALANVGRTVGTYAVSPTGAATYTIPIWAPRAPNGLEPQIALVYNSQQTAGYLGAGWSLSGISEIFRCNRTVAQDGTASPVTLTTSDALCLDGQRLQLTGGTYGEAGSTYQTEIANFEQVTAYGSAGNGPGYFIVQGPNGTQYEYGNVGGSQVLANGTSTASAWYLDKITDSAGNTLTFSYSSSGLGSVVPTTLSWTPGSYGATTYNYTMQFTYGTNSTASSYYGYIGGTEVTNTDLLQSITVSYQGNTVKKYALTYQPSPTTGAEELSQVEECADAAQSNCLAPTTFGYQDPSVGTTSTATSVAAGALSPIVWNYDFNGDGQDDLAFCNTSHQLEVAFASPSGGYGTPITTTISCANNLSVQFGDLLGTGQDGILAVNGSTWYYYQWSGSSFVGQSTGLAFDTSGVQFVLADVDGDGRPDLVELTETPLSVATTATIYVRLNTSSATTVSFSATNAQWYTVTAPSGRQFSYAQLQNGSNGQSGILQSGNVRRLDFNGDGRDDLAFEYQIMWCVTVKGVCTEHYSDSANELISTGSGFGLTNIGTQGTLTAPLVAFLNFNSDKCTDYLYSSTIFVSGCDGTLPATVTVPSSSIVGVIDWNADGRGDILVNNGGTIGVYESTGTGLGSLITTSISYNSLDEYFGFDPAGDQLEALGAWETGASPFSVSFYPHNGAGTPPDLITSITDGYGNTITPAYVSIARSVNSIYFPGQDATYPYAAYLGALYVVSETTFSDPTNPPSGTYSQQDFYARAWINLQGRGFAGFEAHQILDSRNGIYETRDYDLAFPYTGMLTRDLATQNNTAQETIFSRSYTLTDTVLDSTEGAQRYFPDVSNSAESDYEVGGTENTALIKSRTGDYSYDDFGNLTSETLITTDPATGNFWTTTVNNTPDVDTADWCLNQITKSTISYSASDGSTPVTRTKEYVADPDSIRCRYIQITTEPSSGSYEVIEALGYDSFGNVNTDGITGIGMTLRQTSANWGTTGQFPMSVTDAGGATTQFNYNFSYGLVSSETDPNSSAGDPMVTSWTYGDGFGRLTQETRPDGTYSTYTYNNCVNVGGCLLGANTLAVSHYDYTTGGSIETDGTTYFDELERPIIANVMMLSGTEWNRNEVRYDSLGRVVQRAAPCIWSAVTGTCPYWTTMSYDIMNRITQTQRRVSQGDSSLQTTTYAYAGDTTTITDPNENARTLTKDVNGWLRETEDSMGYAITLGYDAAGAKTSVTDNQGNGPSMPLWTGTYAYGIAPFLTGETDVDRGNWGYTVDALGERTAWTDAKGQHFAEAYDALSRPLSRTEPDLFTQWTWGTSATSHNIGKVASVCSGTGSSCSSSNYSESETYDNLGRLFQRSVVIPAMGTYTYTWQYNATTGLLDTLTYPTGSSGKALELKYGYQSGILKSITDILDSPNVTIWQAGADNAATQITQETLGNGLMTNRAYDGVTHWLSSVQSGPGGGASIQNLSFLYDEIGNVTQRQDGVHILSENFYYDNDYRLSYSTLNGAQNLALNYDAKGNITSSTNVASGATWTYDPVHVHQATEAGSTAFKYAYDVNGNMSSWKGEPVTWTSYNYPAKITGPSETYTFSYAPDRTVWREIQTGSPADTTYRLGSTLMSIVVGSSGTTDRNYIYAGGEPVAIDERKSSSNTFYYLLTDHQGSLYGITNASGGMVVGESFHAPGQRRNSTTWTDPISGTDVNTIAGITPRGYTFKETLLGLGLNDLVGRVEDSVTGRFLSADPTIPYPEDPQSYNRYSYVRNNPLTYIDPSGFNDDDSCPTDGCGGGGSNSNGSSPNGGNPGGGDDPPSAGTLPPVVIQSNSGLPPIDITGLLSELAGVGPAQGMGQGSHVGGGGNSANPSTPSSQQSNPSGCAYVACPVVQATREPPLPFALPPAITPGMIAFDYDENFLQRTLEAIGLLTRAGIVSIQLHNPTGEPQDGPVPPEAGTPEPQTTELPYNPPASEPTLIYDPQTGEMVLSGRLPLPPEFFEVPIL